MLPVWRYTFVKYMALFYLSDSDVLIRLACVSRLVQQSLAGYTIKQDVKLSKLSNCEQYVVENIVLHDQCIPCVNNIEHKVRFISRLVELPHTIKRLTFTHYFKTIIQPDFFSMSSLQTITFGATFNQPIHLGGLPSNLHSLTFGHCFNQPIFPPRLCRLTFGSQFNQSLTYNQFPDSLTRLTFGTDFNHILNRGILGDSLTHLALGRGYSQILSTKTLPSNLTHLTFYACKYNIKAQSMMIPDTLIELVTCNCFQHQISMLIKLTRKACGYFAH